MADRPPRTILEQAQDATDLAREAFANGAPHIGIAATVLAAQLTQLARLLPPNDPGTDLTRPGEGSRA